MIDILLNLGGLFVLALGSMVMFWFAVLLIIETVAHVRNRSAGE
ncbi:hypothetical protein OG401_23920 [Kitasatospora purpeofusca]|nr:hypothetical protein [Kitasatospora purpeofusca]MCX4687312.1 hypothetical protein [Kitasatospora purpeofusca]